MTRLLLIALLLLAGAAHATVLWSSNAESLACNDGVSSSVWDYTQSGDSPNSRMYARCDTPVPSTGRSKYFRVDTVNLQHDSYNIYTVSTINLTTGATYYMGAFFRFDRISSSDIWADTSDPNSYDKLFEMHGNIRWIILAGWNNTYTGSFDGKFTFDLYSSPAYCTDCGYSEKTANVSPYSNTNPYLCDYGRWYAVVMAITPSSGGSATDGLVELYINGTKTTSLAQRVQDTSSPSITEFWHSGTTAQPSYNAPAHYRKFDGFTFATSLSDMTSAGLMSDPEGGLLAAPKNPRSRPAPRRRRKKA